MKHEQSPISIHSTHPIGFGIDIVVKKLSAKTLQFTLQISPIVLGWTNPIRTKDTKGPGGCESSPIINSSRAGYIEAMKEDTWYTVSSRELAIIPIGV